MIDRTVEELRSQDWEDIGAKVLENAGVLASRYGWGPDRSLPDGSSLEDLVIAAISEIWETPARRKPEVALVVQLTGFVRHKLWNLAKGRHSKVKSSPELDSLPARERGQGEKTRTELDCALQLLADHPKVKASEELSLMVMAMACGSCTVDELVNETKFERDRVYQLRHELKQIYPSVARHLRTGGEQ